MNKTRKNREKISNGVLVIVMMALLFAGIPTIEVKAASNTHEHNDYTAINSTNWDDLLVEPGNYYLTEDITITSRIDITSGTVNLCLNGKKISSAFNSSVFRVEDATLNIYDCAGGGIITGGKGYAYDGGNQKGGAIYLRHGTLNMYGGTITGNNAVWGGAVFIDGSNRASVFNMYGGTISGNVAQQGGGGIEVENDNSYFNMYGGSIINNSVTNINGDLHKGGGVHFANGTVRLYGTHGDILIKDNTVAGVENNLYLRSDKMITVPSTASISSNSSIGVSCADCEVAGGSSNNETIVNSYGANKNRCFFVDGTNLSSHLMVYENGGVSIVKTSNHMHSWVKGELTAPTITNVGITSYTCSTCGGTKEDKTYLSVNDEKITIENVNTLTYNGQVQSQKLNVYYDGELLSEDTHYTISGCNNTNAGNYNLTITGKGSFKGTRTLGYVINKAPLIVTVNNEEVTYGDAVPMYAVTYSGFENNETKDVLTGNLTFSCDYAQYSNVSNYDIVASGYQSGNYEITYVKGSVKVNPKEVGLEWSNLLLTYNCNEQLPTATVTGLVNGDICTVTVTGAKTNAGVYIATVENLSNDNYMLPENAAVEFVIQKVCEADEVTSDDKVVIEEALELIEDLLLEDNLTDEERDAIEQQKADLTEKLNNIKAAADRREAVDETVNTLPETGKVTSANKESITEALDVIDQLLAPENVGNLTETEKAAVEAQKADLTEKLEKIETAEEGMKKVEETATSIPPASEVTSEEKESIEEALEIIGDLLAPENVGNLTEEQVEFIENLKEELQEKLDIIHAIEDSLNEIKNELAVQPDYDDITSDNKEDIKDIIEDIESVLKDEKENLSSEEVEALEELKKELEDKVTFIEQIEKYEPVLGDFKNTTKPKVNDYDGNLEIDSHELIGIISLEKTEKEHVAKGETVKVYLEVSDITETITEEDKKLIETEIEDKEVAIYLDITLFKQVGEREPKKVPNINGLVTITFQVPSNLVNTDSSVARKYQIVRVHEGEVSIIDAVYDEITGEISFETDKFSTYALIYEDVAVKNPQTGDATATWPWLLLMMGFGMMVISVKTEIMYKLKKR